MFSHALPPAGSLPAIDPSGKGSQRDRPPARTREGARTAWLDGPTGRVDCAGLPPLRGVHQHCGRGSWSRTPNSRGAACTLIARGLVAEEPCPAFGGSDEFAASMPGASWRALAEGIRHRRDASPAVLMRRLFSLDYLMEHATCLGFAPRARCEGRPKPGPPGRVSTSKRPMRRVEPERPRLRRTGLSAAPKAGEPAYPLGPRFAGPRQGLARVAPPPSIPWTPALRQAMARTRPAGRAHRRQPQPPRGSFGLGRAPTPTSLGRLAEPPSW